mmetsp:Transcript_86162/g.240983  ORF Transcript_86162/g.240983 Transcript_86162/m.240983 type:complete len:254 (+) Transcript_86162:477-1238(+)
MALRKSQFLAPGSAFAANRASHNATQPAPAASINGVSCPRVEAMFGDAFACSSISAAACWLRRQAHNNAVQPVSGPCSSRYPRWALVAAAPSDPCNGCASVGAHAAAQRLRTSSSHPSPAARARSVLPSSAEKIGAKRSTPNIVNSAARAAKCPAATAPSPRTAPRRRATSRNAASLLWSLLGVGTSETRTSKASRQLPEQSSHRCHAEKLTSWGPFPPSPRPWWLQYMKQMLQSNPFSFASAPAMHQSPNLL